MELFHAAPKIRDRTGISWPKPKLILPEPTPSRLVEYAGDYWSEELQVINRLEIHDEKLATRHRSGTWIHFLPTGTDRFDADRGEFSLEFQRGPGAEATEVKASGGRVRNIRYVRVKLPD